MVDRYWRQEINSVKDEFENSMQIVGILLKLKEYDEKLNDISRIDENKEDISSNLKKINTNKNDISTNKNDIATNKSSININTNDISTNTKLINANISFYNLNKIYI